MLAYTVRRGIYKPKIQFRRNKKPTFRPADVEKAPVPTEPYQRPRYLSFKGLLEKDEIEMVNQGGFEPTVNWKKVKAIKYSKED
mmetsp:Transcript_7421/g.7292  ORF Transcript_7421/g.7292 Transcript_7421/m.7292 type:complete len:84 (+) Transcript_7421:39-290(+)